MLPRDPARRGPSPLRSLHNLRAHRIGIGQATVASCLIGVGGNANGIANSAWLPVSAGRMRRTAPCGGQRSILPRASLPGACVRLRRTTLPTVRMCSEASPSPRLGAEVRRMSQESRRVREPQPYRRRDGSWLGLVGEPPTEAAAHRCSAGPCTALRGWSGWSRSMRKWRRRTSGASVLFLVEPGWLSTVNCDSPTPTIAAACECVAVSKLSCKKNVVTEAGPMSPIVHSRGSLGMAQNN